MTEYELEDVLTSTTNASLEAFTIYITLVASYLIVAYIAGRNLTHQQILIVSILFVFAALLATFSAYSYLARAIPMADALELMHPGRRYGAQPFTAYWIGILMLMGVLASLYFMWQVRHTKTE